VERDADTSLNVRQTTAALAQTVSRAERPVRIIS
jgi:hypothetical protein